MPERNPSWTRDELIITLDFYLRYTPIIPSKTSQQILDLSTFLNQLREKVGAKGDEKFRNPNGVYMKLMNFRRFDPDYKGAGLERGGKEDEVVWNLYANTPAELRKINQAVRAFTLSDAPIKLQQQIDEPDAEGEEGRMLSRVHQIRERDPKLVSLKKEQVHREHNRLACEVCGFDFSGFYGQRGDGFIECHHTNPLSELRPTDKTRVSDLALVCSNCHRMIHRRKPWLSVSELSAMVLRPLGG